MKAILPHFSTTFILLAFIVGCNSSSNMGDAKSKSSESGTSLTIAVVPKCTGGEFWETVERGVRDAGKDLGVEIKWEGTLTETEIAEQNRVIENMINLEVDGMAIAPLNPCLLYTSPSPRDQRGSRMPSSA